jgi:HSP20 family protein
MNITRWEPFREFDAFFDQYPSLFSRALRRNDELGSNWKPLADLTENDKEFLIKAQLPEVKKEDIKVSVEDGVITISGERKQEKETKNESEIRTESFYGTFSRSFSLPDNVDTKAIRAETKDGVLRVHVPKTESTKTKPVQIEVK